jgi:predicted HTH domain antitoxin
MKAVSPERQESMSRKLTLELELPDDVVSGLLDEDLTSKAKEALVMELLREHRVSQGKAAAILSLSREDLFPLMTKYKVPVIDLTDEELGEELRQPFPHN